MATPHTSKKKQSTSSIESPSIWSLHPWTHFNNVDFWSERRGKCRQRDQDILAA